KNGELDTSYVEKPIEDPKPDGSGMHLVYPSNEPMELRTTGALSKGGRVEISSSQFNNVNVTISGNSGVSISADNINSRGGALEAREGLLALTANDNIELENTRLTAETIQIVAGGDFTGRGVEIASKKDTSIFAVGDATLTSVEHRY